MWHISPRLARKINAACFLPSLHKIKLFDWLAEVLTNQGALFCDVWTLDGSCHPKQFEKMD